MTGTLTALLLRLSEGGDPAPLPGLLAKRYFGPAFDRLLTSGVIEEVEPADSWPTCTACDCGLEERPIEPAGKAFVAICPLDADANATLTHVDRRSFLLHGRRLASLVLDLPAPPPEPLTGLWQPGVSVGGRELFFALARKVVANPALVAVICRHTRRRAVLVGPEPPAASTVHLREAGIVVVPSKRVIGADERGRPSLDQTTIVRMMRGGPARLEVRVSERVVLIDGTPQYVPERPFQLLRMLVEKVVNGGRLLRLSEFEAATQRTPSDVLRELKAALTKGRVTAREIEGWFVNHRSVGYELALDPDQIELSP